MFKMISRNALGLTDEQLEHIVNSEPLDMQGDVTAAVMIPWEGPPNKGAAEIRRLILTAMKEEPKEYTPAVIGAFRPPRPMEIKDPAAFKIVGLPIPHIQPKKDWLISRHTALRDAIMARSSRRVAIPEDILVEYNEIIATLWGQKFSGDGQTG